MKIYLIKLDNHIECAYLDQEKARKALKEEADKRCMNYEFFQYVTPNCYTWDSWSGGRSHCLRIEELEVIDG